MATIDLVPESDDLELQVRDLREQLERERARNAGLEQGIVALTARVEALQAALKGSDLPSAQTPE